MSFKYAFRNLIRSPWRTILYIAVAFLITLSVTASLFIYGAADRAKTETEENYMFVASLIPQRKDSLVLSDIKYCLGGTDVLAYNISMSSFEAVVLGGEYLFHLPEKVNNEDASFNWRSDIACDMVAVENLGMMYPFFTGKCTIKEGTAFTTAGYMGEKAEAVIPWWLAEEYGAKIGDTIIRRYFNESAQNLYTYYETEVVGIYETSNPDPDKENYPVYMPLSVAEFDYGVLYGSKDVITIHRADLLLKGRDSFEVLVMKAEESGLDFTNANLIFNNRQYDVLISELDDIHMIALIVAVVVLAVGMGMLVFFTIYLCTSRKGERVLLASLGMEKRKVLSIFVIELALMLVLSVGGGFLMGRYAADAVCSYVETSVSEKAVASDMIEQSGERDVLLDHEPMEPNFELDISVSGGSVSIKKPDIHYITNLKDGEIGYAKGNYYEVGSNVREIKDAEQIPVTVFGFSDFDALGIKVTEEQETREHWISVYVSESFDRSRVDTKNFNRFFIKQYGKEDYINLYATYDPGIREGTNQDGVALFIAGTYADNDYVSGNDLLVSLEDYHKIRQEFSVTDEEFYFERMEIFENEHDRTDSDE